MAIKNKAYKNWLTVGLVAAALSVSACGKKDDAPMDAEPAADAQTAVENDATGVATANSTDGVATAGGTDDVGVASANEPAIVTGNVTNDTNTTNANSNATDGMAVGENDDVGVATADDAEVLDGTESEEHISTY